MDTGETAELRDSIHHYQNMLADCTDAEAKVILRELMDELEEKFARTSDHRVAAKWPSKAA